MSVCDQARDKSNQKFDWGKLVTVFIGNASACPWEILKSIGSQKHKREYEVKVQVRKVFLVQFG